LCTKYVEKGTWQPIVYCVQRTLIKWVTTSFSLVCVHRILLVLVCSVTKSTRFNCRQPATVPADLRILKGCQRTPRQLGCLPSVLLWRARRTDVKWSSWERTAR